MSVLNALFISTLAGLSTIIGGLIIFIKIKKDKINRFISFCLSFSISIMIGISITDLIPESYFKLINLFNPCKGLIIILISFIIGIVITTFMDKLIKSNSNSLYKLGILNMLALIIHNFPEGIITFMGSIKSISLGLRLSLAIMLHNIPEGISIAVPLYYSTNNKKKAILSTFLSGLAEPLGAIFAYIIFYKYINDTILSIILILVAGIMISLAINEMLPKAISYKNNKSIYIGLLLGIIVIIINILLF